MREKLPLFFGLLLFIISIYPIYLMAYELVSETIITSKYTFKSLNLMKI